MSRQSFAGEIYHVLSRGVDKRNIFMDDSDHLRFIHDLFEFNDQNPKNNISYYFQNQSIDIASPYIKKRRQPRKLLVEILTFSLMPNHYHLLLRPKIDNGVSKFMRKLNIGYSKYFNEKYKRTGTLFEGRYKTILVKDEAHFIHLPYYIHLNPLDLISPEWRDRELKDYKKALNFLKSYRWSGHLDYAGIKNFPSVTQREILLKFFDGNTGYINRLEDWLKHINLKNIDNVILE